VAIDRAAILKNADKLLKQGKLEPAIAEYVRVVEDQPRDFGTANALGDLYVRAKRIDKAVEQFVRIADSLSEDGFLPKAAALYKKIIKIKPDHEHALLQAAELAASQGLYADARGYLTLVADKKAAAGDKRGQAQMRIRIGNLDPADYPARVGAARARLDINDAAGAVRDLKEVAAELTEKARPTEAVDVLREAAQISPDDQSIRSLLFDAYVSSDDSTRAAECATTAAQFKNLAAVLEAKGHGDEALRMLGSAARLDPSDTELRVHLAKTFVARGDQAAAAEYLTEETAGGDPQLLLLVAEMRLRSGASGEGLAIASRLLDGDPQLRDRVAMVGWNVADQVPDAGYALVELAAAVSERQGDWGAAAAAVQEFVTRVPSHLPALMRLVEICVDGSLEATLYTAQAQLADAYITAGMADEARFISEDLVAREPWDRANIERFRKTLVMTNEPDPDAIIAERLSGQTPFMSTDLTFPPFEEPLFEAAPECAVGPGAAAETGMDDAPSGAVPSAATGEPAVPSSGVVASADAGELGPAKAHARTDSVEVDLSVVLNEPVPTGSPAVALKSAKAATLDGVFDQLREEATRRGTNDAAENEYKRAQALQKDGDVDGAIAALERASRAPSLRFQTAAQLGRLYKQRGMELRSLEWMERAADAPAPSPGEQHELLYDLAEALEANGEADRALTTLLELQSGAGAFRDVNARIDRLAKVTRG